MTEGVGVRVLVIQEFLFSVSSRLALGATQLSIQWVYWMRVGAFNLRVKRSRRKTDHKPPITAEVLKTWIYTLTPIHLFKV
jgi:hypothetical protein